VIPAEEMLFREYDAALEGSRHNATSRSQYLGFFFTILFAAVAYLGSAAKDGGLSHPWQAATASLLLWIVTLLSCLTFIAVAKFGRVMEHQSHVRERIREHFLTATDRDLLGAKEIKVGKDDPYPHSLFTVQRSAEATLELGAARAIAGQRALALRFSLVAASLGVRVALWLVAISSLAGAATVARRKRDFIVLSAEIHPDHPGCK
jgi:hypothetical protein